MQLRCESKTRIICKSDQTHFLLHVLTRSKRRMLRRSSRLSGANNGGTDERRSQEASSSISSMQGWQPGKGRHPDITKYRARYPPYNRPKVECNRYRPCMKRKAEIGWYWKFPGGLPVVVVGESFFGVKYRDKHERLLQLMCVSTGDRWYIKESKTRRVKPGEQDS